MKEIKRGLGFGVTSGIITTLGLMMSLYSGTNSKQVILAGILAITIADAVSHAFGIHISEELADKKATEKQIWTSTGSTFIFHIITASILALPIILMELRTAIITSILLGFIIMTIFSYFIAKQKHKKPFIIIAEHIIITSIIITISYLLGAFTSKF